MLQINNQKEKTGWLTKLGNQFFLFTELFFFLSFYNPFLSFLFSLFIKMSHKYNTYLKSEWWKYLREKRLKKHNYCQACGNNYNLQIHHYNYEFKYAGRASKAIKHTKVLCSTCHKLFHEMYPLKKDMTKHMNQFISMINLEKRNACKIWKEIKEREDWLKYV